MTLATLRATMTQEEILGWSCYFGVLNDEQERSIEEAKRRR